MIAALAVSGWAAAAVAVASGVMCERRHARRLEQVARASHELRGPLTAAHLGLRLAVRADEISTTRLRALELELARAALALQDLTAVGGRATGLRLERLELGAVVCECVEVLQPAAVGRGAELCLSWPDGEAVVVADRLRLAQALGNLIGNAIEHGGGVIEVCGRIDGELVRVEVTDGGPGLPAPVAKLTSRARAGRGWRGRGLAIACQVARDHGGRVAAAPSDRGARLVLELPLRSRAGLTRSA